MGILQRIGRGKFTLGESKIYFPEISSKMKSIYSKIKVEFPYINLCIFNTSSLNEFMLHQPSQFYSLVEVDKDAIDSIFYLLREEKLSVFLDPTKDILEKYLLNKKEVIVVKSLVSEAPTQIVQNINTGTIEKILVDIFCGDEIFSAQQGAEMRTIFKEAFTKYTINESKMLRYADRRGKKESFKNFINSVTNLRQ